MIAVFCFLYSNYILYNYLTNVYGIIDILDTLLYNFAMVKNNASQRKEPKKMVTRSFIIEENVWNKARMKVFPGSASKIVRRLIQLWLDGKIPAEWLEEEDEENEPE